MIVGSATGGDFGKAKIQASSVRTPRDAGFLIASARIKAGGAQDPQIDLTPGRHLRWVPPAARTAMSAQPVAQRLLQSRLPDCAGHTPMDKSGGNSIGCLPVGPSMRANFTRSTPPLLAGDTLCSSSSAEFGYNVDPYVDDAMVKALEKATRISELVDRARRPSRRADTSVRIGGGGLSFSRGNYCRLRRLSVSLARDILMTACKRAGAVA